MMHLGGKWCLFVFLSIPLISASNAGNTRVDMTFMTPDGVPSSTARVGERYRLEVRIHGTQRAQRWPQIPGLPPEYIVGRRQRREVSVIQGRQSVITAYEFDLVFSQVGTYVIGPLRIEMDQGNFATASQLTIEIQEKAPTASSSPKEPLCYFAQWELAKQETYVGERIPCTLSFYTNDAHIKLENISFEQAPGIAIQLQEQAQWDTVEHVGTQYRRCSWHGSLYAERAASFLLPIATISFFGTQKTQSFWNHFASFMMRPPEQRSAPALTLVVRELPATLQKPVIGVGRIDSVRWEISSAEVVVGKTIEAKRIVEGAFVPHLLHMPTPSIIGNKGNAYESRSGCMPNQLPDQITFEQEFVIHATQDGESGIPSATYYLFNPTEKKYEEYTLKGISWNVLPAQDTQETQDLNTILSTAESIPECNNNAQNRAVSTSYEYEVPFNLWLLFILFPPLCICIRQGTFPLRIRLRRWWKHRGTMHATMNRITQAQVRHDGYQLIQAIELFALHLLEETKSPQSEAWLNQWLIEHNAPQKIRESWSSFYQQLQEAAFGTMSQHALEVLGDKAKQWVQKLHTLRQGEAL